MTRGRHVRQDNANDPGQHKRILSHDAEVGNASIVVTVSTISLALV